MMCDSRRPSNGADAVDDRGATDYICENGHTVYSGHLFTYNGRSLCRECAVRESGEPACSYCSRPSFGDYRIVGDPPTIACGSCTDHWADSYEQAVAS